MAGYVKIWTTIEGEWWFQKLGGTDRGIVLQLLVFAKKDGDTGTIFVRSWRQLADRLGLNHETVAKSVTKIASTPFLELNMDYNGLIALHLPKYKKWQELTSYKEHLNTVAENRQTGDKSSKNRPLTRPDQTKPEQTRPLAPPDVCVEIVTDLNLKAGTSFKPESKATQKLIAARIAEGHTVEDFRRVHTNKVRDWLNDPKMVKFLRPETLYRASHFESYLNEREVTNERTGTAVKPGVGKYSHV